MKISIAGCGNMGLVYARAFLKYNIVSENDLVLIEKNSARRDELQKLKIGEVVTSESSEISKSDILIIAVKPQDFENFSKEIKKIGEKTVVISIIAGIKIKTIREKINHSAIVRAMPNSPAELGMGTTGFCANEILSTEQIRKAENLLATTGRTIYFENEDLLDAVTALSGSGPAYFFYIVKNMIEAGKQMGFDESTSAMLVKQTMLGSFHLLNTANKSLDELISAVASKGGTTEAAFSVFNEKKIGQNLQKGIIKARDRAKELSI